MQLTPEDIQSFIEMWQKAYDETLTPGQAEMEAKRLIDFFLTLAEERMDDRQSN